MSDNLSSDQPLRDPQDDLLEYAPFARRLADSILKLTAPQGMVVGVFGPWGAGKSTIINFIEHYLEAASDDLQPVIVRFNPWWFSGREDVTRRFMEQLSVSLRKHGGMSRSATKRVGELGQALSEAPISSLRLIGVFARWFGSRKRDIVGLKQAVARELGKKSKLIVSLIDDVDRLSKEEMQEFFGLLKAVGDLPNTTYVVGLDRAAVVQALQGVQGSSGEDYLEKIIQVPFELPLPDQATLRTMMFHRLDILIADTPDELFDSDRWANVFYEGIDPFIETPRDVTRIANALSITYPPVIGEVSPVDFIALETMRVMIPLAYEVVRRNPEQFVGLTRAPIFGRSDDESAALRDFHQAWLADLDDDDRRRVTGVLSQLFPKFGAAQGGLAYGSDALAEWRRQLRVCSEEIFPVFFRLRVPPSGVSSGEVRGLLALARDQQALEEALLKFASTETNRAAEIKALLERISDFADAGMEAEEATVVLRALFNIGDAFLPLDPQAISLTGTRMSVAIGRIVYRLIREMPPRRRLPALLDAISKGQAVSTMVHEVAVLGQQHGKYGATPQPPSERFVSEDDLRTLENALARKIQARAEAGALAETPELAGLLYRWIDWADEATVQEWVESEVSTDSGLARFIEAFLSTSTVYTSGPSATSYVKYTLDPEVLRPFIDPERLVDRIRNLPEATDLSERQSKAVEEYLRGWEARQSGRNPLD